MFWMGKEKKRLLRKAELVVPVASILALSLDKIAMPIADEYDVDYPPMNPRILFAYTIGGAAVAVMTASVSVMEQVGVTTFGKAVDKGRASSQRSTLLPDNATLYAKEDFEYMLKSYALFRYSPENAGQGAEENIGTWIWRNMQDEVPGPVPLGFRGKLIAVSGFAVIREFGPYWLSEDE